MSSYRPYSSHRYPPSTYGSSYVSSDPFYDEDEDELLYGGRTYHRAIPGIAHKRMTMVTPPPHSVKTNRIYSELERAAYRPRVMVSTSPVPEDYLDSPTMLDFDYTDYEPNVWSTTSAGLHLQTILNEKIRDIRTQAQNLLDRQNPSRFDPPVRRPIVYYTSSQYEIPETKHENEYKVHALRDVQRDVQEHVFNKSLYNEPVRRANIGKGHLACMTFAGGKPQAIRRRKYVPEVDQDKVLNDVTYLSYYDKTQSEVNRQQTDSHLLRHRKVPYGETSHQGAYNIRTYPIPPMDFLDKKEEPVSATETGAAPEKAETAPPAAAETEVPPPPAVTEAEVPPAPVEAEVPPAPVTEVPPTKEEAPPAKETPAEAPPQPAEVAATPTPVETPAEAPPAKETPAEAPVTPAEAPAAPVEAPAAPVEAPAAPVEPPAAPVEPPAAESAATEPQAVGDTPKEAGAESTAAETPAAAPGPLTE